MSEPRILWIEPLAPPKPLPGQPCNGCGVCCLYQPCPLARLLRGRLRAGGCRWLRWEASGRQYRCAALAEPQAVLQALWPRWLHALARRLAPLLRRLARRWIAAGQGCDCTLQVRAVAETAVAAGGPADGQSRP
ncbi:MAG: hypothetical protein ACK4J1_09900 [Hylemonella sp.]